MRPDPQPALDSPRFCRALDDAGWQWMEGRARGLLSGSPVTLPHCWNAAGEYLPGVLPRRGWATYQLDFDLPEWDGQREWRLRCGGFYGVGQAWLNGQSIGRFNGDYLGFDLEATGALQAGPNRIVIQVCNRYARNILPGIPDPDFHLYGGLGGGMHLAALPRVRLSRDDGPMTMDETHPGDVCVEIGMANRGGSCAGTSVQIAIRDPAGRVVAESQSVEVALSPDETARREIRCTIPGAQLWSPENPVLYAVEATLRQGGRVLDRLSWNFGLRTARFDREQGFTLNGRPFVLRGVNRHENVPGLGFALPRALHEADARQIKALGLNFVRLSHYPQSPAFLDACDRLGILVYAELCSWKKIRGGGWLAAAESQLERMIRRDRHHPSLILWGLGNEGRDRKVFLRLMELARTLDPSRPTIYAENHAYRARRKKTAGLTDVWGLNYEFDALDFARSSAPSGCVVVSECANLPYARRGHWPAEAQQLQLIRDAVQRVEGAGPGAAGWALWGFADYATPRRQRWFRECGVVDGWRVPKMAADWLQARYGAAPFLSVRGDWSFAAGPRRRLYFVTNCTEIKILRAEGSSETRATPVPDLYEIDLDFDGGPIRFVGNGAEATLLPWGEPARFSVRTETMASNLFRCWLQVADEHGAPVQGFEGDARIRLPAGARGSLVGSERAPVHAGAAAWTVETARPAEKIAMECAVDGFPAQTIFLGGAP
ncbi:MAG TPA: hypothetical protein DCM68_04800 [Verrucomicrobia bacterium]|nr:hypothetical protein [Verrucomicrobiota bacterium]